MTTRRRARSTTTDFRGRTGVQPDGTIDPGADRAAKRFWAGRDRKARRPRSRRGRPR